MTSNCLSDIKDVKVDANLAYYNKESLGIFEIFIDLRDPKNKLVFRRPRTFIQYKVSFDILLIKGEIKMIQCPNDKIDNIEKMVHDSDLNLDDYNLFPFASDIRQNIWINVSIPYEKPIYFYLSETCLLVRNIKIDYEYVSHY